MRGAFAGKFARHTFALRHRLEESAGQRELCGHAKVQIGGNPRRQEGKPAFGQILDKFAIEYLAAVRRIKIRATIGNDGFRAPLVGRGVEARRLSIRRQFDIFYYCSANFVAFDTQYARCITALVRIQCKD